MGVVNAARTVGAINLARTVGATIIIQFAFILLRTRVSYGYEGFSKNIKGDVIYASFS